MSSSNFSSIPSVIELQQVRARNEFRWKKFGKIPRLPWSFKPEQAKGNYIFKPQQGDDWQTGIGHCDTKTKPKRLIISDVDGEHFSVLTNKDYFTYPQFQQFNDAKAACGVGSAGLKALWKTLPHADCAEKSGWTSTFYDCEVLDVRDSDESFKCQFKNDEDPSDCCRWVPFPCLFSLPAFEKYVQEKYPSQGKANDVLASSECADVSAAKQKLDDIAILSTPFSAPVEIESSPAATAALSATSLAATPTAAAASVCAQAVATPSVSSAVAPSPVASAPSHSQSLTSVVSYLSQRYVLFVAPVDPKFFSGYSKIVKKPMSLSVISSMIAKLGAAYNAQALWQDIQLMCNNCRSYWTTYNDPVMISQADALEAEASTRLKGLLAAAAAALPVAPIQIAAAPVVTPLASKVNTAPKGVSSTTEVAAKRPRDPADDRAPKKQTQAQVSPPRLVVKPDASASALAQSAKITGNQAALNSGVLNAVVPAKITAMASATTPGATLLTENSVSSLEADSTELEDLQAKYQAELAWYRQEMAEKERRELLEMEKKAERKAHASKYAAELLGQTLYVQSLQHLPGVTKQEHAALTAVEGEIWLPCVDGLMRVLQQTDSGSGSGVIPQFAPWW